ncbi:MAG: diguanylate cyclase [Spirochaetales bacterium]|nr:diguanylate cyclase [Spirochaetales bacterium]
MNNTGSRGIPLFWRMFFYQLCFLLLLFTAIETGMFLTMEKEVIRITGEELKKRNQLLQLALEDPFQPEKSFDSPDFEGTGELPPPHPVFSPESGEILPLPPPREGTFLPTANSQRTISQRMVNTQLEARIREIAELTETRFTVLAPDGEVKFDSLYEYDKLANMSSYSEIADLLSGKEQEASLAVRVDEISRKKNIYQALPIISKGRIIGITRVSEPYKYIENLTRRMSRIVRISATGAIGLITLLLIPQIRWEVNLVKTLEETALAIAGGQFNNPRPKARTREFNSLIASMDHMAHMLKEQIETIEEQSLIDELTGLSNRRRFNEKLDYDWWLCLRSKKPLSFLILDIDHFKNYNDSLGHPAGDRCLQEISTILRESANRHTDFPIRLGGEEFGLLLPETTEEQAYKLALKILNNINGAALPHPDSETAPHVTVSIGVTSLLPSLDRDMKELMEQADQALYKAKEKGRNRAIIHSRLDHLA